MANSAISPKTLSKMASNRLQKELKEMQENPIVGITLQDSDNLKEWVFALTVPPGSVYANKTYKIRITFPYEYPIQPPKVMFLQPAPVHPQVLSCGHTCVDALSSDWTPAITVKSICANVLIMLSSSTQLSKEGLERKERKNCFHSRL